MLKIWSILIDSGTLGFRYKIINYYLSANYRRMCSGMPVYNLLGMSRVQLALKITDLRNERDDLSKTREANGFSDTSQA